MILSTKIVPGRAHTWEITLNGKVVWTQTALVAIDEINDLLKDPPRGVEVPNNPRPDSGKFKGQRHRLAIQQRKES